MYRKLRSVAMCATLLYIVFFMITASTLAAPSFEIEIDTHIEIPIDSTPPTRYNGDGTPVDPNAKPQLRARNRQNRFKGGYPSEKYFHEADFDSHYDGRFATRWYGPEERIPHLRALLRTYLATMNSLRAETWIMHGSLLGWWWNQRIMPWDSDLDVQVSESALSYLAAHHNMSVYSFQDVEWLGALDISNRDPVRKQDHDGENANKRQYLLEINPNWKNGSYSDENNVIDARWIDMSTGLYIDITTVRLNTSHPDPGTLYCKDRHHYHTRQIFPLRASTFEGVPAKVPYAYQELLAEEYGTKSLVQKVFRREGHYFDDEAKEWKRITNTQGDGRFRQFDTYEEQRQKARKSRQRPNAMAGRLNAREQNDYSVWRVLARLFVGV